MEKKLIEWAKKIDAELIKQGKAPKGSDDNQQAATLLAKIRTVATATDGAKEVLSNGSSNLPQLYGDLASTAKTKHGTEEGRRDKRSQVFGIEANRWAGATSAANAVLAALSRRQIQITMLETEFLSTFAKNTGGMDAPGSPGTKY